MGSETLYNADGGMDVLENPPEWVKVGDDGSPLYLPQYAPFGFWQVLIDRYMLGYESVAFESDATDWYHQQYDDTGSKRKFGITAAKAEKFFTVLENGGFLSTALKFAGITPVMFYKWMELSGSPRFASKTPIETARDPFVTFGVLFELVEALPEINSTMVLANSGDWKARLAFLERRYPQRWGKMESKVNVGVITTATGGGASAQSGVVIMLPDNHRGDGPDEAEADDVTTPETHGEIDAATMIDAGAIEADWT